MALKTGSILIPSWVLPPLPPAPVPVHQLYWEPPPPPLGKAALPQGNPLVLSPFPLTPVVAGQGGSALTGAGPLKITAQHGTAGKPAGSLLTQSAVLVQAPLIGGAPAVLHGGVQPPAPLLLRAPPMTTFVPAPAPGRVHADDGMWPQGLRPPAIPPVAPAMSGVNMKPTPHRDCGEGGLGTSEVKATPDHTCKSPSVYENFRRWQHIKTLLRRHLPHTRDIEAVSCFLVPVLRSLSRRQLTTSVQQGLRIGLREWDRTSNYERMTFYEVAREFMEFEAAEEAGVLNLQLMGGLLGHPPAAPPRPEPPRPPAPEVGQQPVCKPRHTDLDEWAACPPAPKCQQPQETEAPDEIPPEAVREYIDIMDWLEEHHLLAIMEPEENQEEEQQQEEEQEIFPDTDLLSYCNELCSQESFVTKVEAIINPQFLQEAESTDRDRDIISAVIQELEEEYGLTPEELEEKRLLGCKAKGAVCGPRSRGAADQQAHREECDPKRRVHKDTCPPPTASQGLKRSRATDEELLAPEVPVLLRRRHSPAPLAASPCSALPQDLAPRGTLGLRGACPTGVPCEPACGPGEDDGDLSSLSFLLASPHQLLPWQLSQIPGPDVGLLCPEGPALQASPPRGTRLSSDLHPSARARKRVFRGGPAPVRKMSRPGPSCEVSGGRDLAQGPVPASGPQKGRCNKFSSQRSRKKH